MLEKVKSLDPLYGREQEILLIRKFNTFYNGINKEPWWLKYHLTVSTFSNKNGIDKTTQGPSYLYSFKFLHLVIGVIITV